MVPPQKFMFWPPNIYNYLEREVGGYIYTADTGTLLSCEAVFCQVNGCTDTQTLHLYILTIETRLESVFPLSSKVKMHMNNETFKRKIFKYLNDR